MRILIVDDDENVASGIRMALTLRGYDADMCGSAEEALERLQTSVWELLISDLRLPGVDGQGLLRRVAEIQPDARRILITGFGTTEIDMFTVMYPQIQGIDLRQDAAWLDVPVYMIALGWLGLHIKPKPFPSAERRYCKEQHHHVQANPVPTHRCGRPAGRL